MIPVVPDPVGDGHRNNNGLSQEQNPGVLSHPGEIGPGQNESCSKEKERVLMGPIRWEAVFLVVALVLIFLGLELWNRHLARKAPIQE